MNAEPERCLKCRGELNRFHLEIGTGYCHPCGHESLAGELVRVRTLAVKLANAAGFSTLTAAAVFYSELERRRM